MIIHSPIISGSLTFADGATVTYPEGGVYSGSFSGSFQGEGSNLTFGGTGIVSSSAQIDALFNIDGIVSSSEQIVDVLSSVNSYTASNDTTNSTQNSRLDQLSNETGSISSEQAAQDSRLDQLSTETGSISTEQAAQDSRLSNIEAATSSYQPTLSITDTTNVDLILSSNTLSANLKGGIVSGSAQITDVLTSVNSYTASNDTTNSTQNSRLDQLSTETGSISTEQAAQDSRLSNLEAETGSISSEQSAQDSRLSNLEASTGSYQGNLSVSDTAQVDMILSGDTLSANLKGGVVSGSSQVFSDITGDVLIAQNGVATIQANSVALGTDTTGNYVATLGSGTGVTIGSNTGEGSTPTIAVNYGSSANTAVQGNTSITFAGTSNEITIDGGSSITLGSGGTVTYGLADTIGGNRTFSGNVTVSGNLTVSGTTTSVNSTTVQIGDNIIELNGSGAANGGIYVKDATASTYTTGSLLWDTTNDKWIAGPLGSEVELVTISGTQTLTNKTIDGSQLVDGSVSNAKLTNSSVTVTAGSGLTTGGSVSLGGSVTLAHADTSTQTSVNNSGRTFIQDITLDTYGHVTAITSATDADTYVGTVTSVGVTAGAGLTGGGTVTTSGTINLDVVGTTDRISVAADSIDIASTYVGQTSITTLGTIGTGVWQGTAIADAYLSSNTAHLSGTQTFSGAKTFSAITTVSNATASTTTTTGGFVVTGGVGIGGALNVGGDVVAYASSDERLKDNIELISNPIEKVQSLKGVTWNWNDNADELQKSLPNVGVIAQDVEKVLPQLVHDRDNGFKGVDYAKLTGLLIEAIKEQQKQIDELKSKLS